MWSRIASPRPRQRAGGGGGSGAGARRNSNTGSIGHGSRPGSVKARDYDHRVGGRTTSIKDRRKAASRNYEDDVEWGEDGGGVGGGGGGGIEYGEWEDSPRGIVSFTPTVMMAPPMRSGAAVDEDEAGDEEEDEDNDEVVASLDSLSSHQSSIMLDRIRGLPAAVAPSVDVAPAAPPPQSTSSTFPRILPIPARYRIRDFLLGDFSFNDDGER